MNYLGENNDRFMLSFLSFGFFDGSGNDFDCTLFPNSMFFVPVKMNSKSFSLA